MAPMLPSIYQPQNVYGRWWRHSRIKTSRKNRLNIILYVVVVFCFLWIVTSSSSYFSRHLSKLICFYMWWVSSEFCFSVRIHSCMKKAKHENWRHLHVFKIFWNIAKNNIWWEWKCVFLFREGVYGGQVLFQNEGYLRKEILKLYYMSYGKRIMFSMGYTKRYCIST